MEASESNFHLTQVDEQNLGPNLPLDKTPLRCKYFHDMMSTSEEHTHEMDSKQTPVVQPMMPISLESAMQAKCKRNMTALLNIYLPAAQIHCCENSV